MVVPKRLIVAFSFIGLLTSQTAIATPSSSVGELRDAATLRSIGLEWDLTGDDDHDATATVQYRDAA